MHGTPSETRERAANQLKARYLFCQTKEDAGRRSWHPSPSASAREDGQCTGGSTSLELNNYPDLSRR